MPSGNNKIYYILTLACFAGYVWLFFNISKKLDDSASETEVCMIKHITNIPCPSCGSTRSILSLFHGDFLKALYWNPLGFVLFLMMIVLPIWIIYDYLKCKKSLLKFYNKTETMLRKKTIALPAIILLLMNWIWNIYKGEKNGFQSDFKKLSEKSDFTLIQEAVGFEKSKLPIFPLLSRAWAFAKSFLLCSNQPAYLNIHVSFHHKRL